MDEFRYEDYTRPIGNPLDRLSEEWWDKHIGLEFVAAQDISSLTSFDAVVATLPFIELLHPRSIFSPGASATLVAGLHQDSIDMLWFDATSIEKATGGELKGCVSGFVMGLYETMPAQSATDSLGDQWAFDGDDRLGSKNTKRESPWFGVPEYDGKHRA